MGLLWRASQCGLWSRVLASSRAVLQASESSCLCQRGWRYAAVQNQQRSQYYHYGNLPGDKISLAVGQPAIVAPDLPADYPASLKAAFRTDPHAAALTIVQELNTSQLALLRGYVNHPSQQGYTGGIEYTENIQEGESVMDMLTRKRTQEITIDTSVAQRQPSRDVLTRVALFAGLPMIVFGFLDNFIMVVMGENIDMTLGIYFGLSTMVAAGVGNLFSDVVGLFFADFFGEQVKQLNIVKEPRMTKVQERLAVTQASRIAGQVIGVSIGCILGLCPMLYYGIFEPRHADKTSSADNCSIDSSHPQAGELAMDGAH